MRIQEHSEARRSRCQITKRAVFLMLAALLSLAAALTIGRMLFIGPSAIRPGVRILLARLSLTNGPEFFVVGERTWSLTEPYEITLYKIEPDRRAFSYYLAFEEPYWWD